MHVRGVVIKSMKSKELMFMETLGNSLLKKIPGCENLHVAPNGQIREKRVVSNHFSQPQPNGPNSSQFYPFQHPDHVRQPQHQQSYPQQHLQNDQLQYQFMQQQFPTYQHQPAYSNQSVSFFQQPQQQILLRVA